MKKWNKSSHYSELKLEQAGAELGNTSFPSTWDVRSHQKNFSPLDKPEHPPLANPFFNRGCQIYEWPYLSPCAKIEETKGTLYPSTFKKIVLKAEI